MRPSTVARFNSVSEIASGFVKLLFRSEMTACRSAGPNELTRSSVVGLTDGEGDKSADGLSDAAGLLWGTGAGAGLWANTLIAKKKPMKANDVN
jgi:hypothetical protein